MMMMMMMMMMMNTNEDEDEERNSLKEHDNLITILPVTTCSLRIDTVSFLYAFTLAGEVKKNEIRQRRAQIRLRGGRKGGGGRKEGWWRRKEGWWGRKEGWWGRLAREGRRGGSDMWVKAKPAPGKARHSSPRHAYRRTHPPTHDEAKVTILPHTHTYTHIHTHSQP